MIRNTLNNLKSCLLNRLNLAKLLNSFKTLCVTKSTLKFAHGMNNKKNRKKKTQNSRRRNKIIRQKKLPNTSLD